MRDGQSEAYPLIPGRAFFRREPRIQKRILPLDSGFAREGTRAPE